MWPKSWFSMCLVCRLLGSYAGTNNADPARDLPLIRAMQSHHRSVGENPLRSLPVASHGLDTDCVSLRDQLNGPEKLKTALVQLDEFADDVEAVAANVVEAPRRQLG